MAGLVGIDAQTRDVFITKEVTNHLFAEEPPHGLGEDLMSLNIQRGRDHGLPGKSTSIFYVSYFSRTLLPSPSSECTVRWLSFTQFVTSVIGISNSLHHFSISSFQLCHGLPFCSFATG